jgi:hypothetical protein
MSATTTASVPITEYCERYENLSTLVGHDDKTFAVEREHRVRSGVKKFD